MERRDKTDQTPPRRARHQRQPYAREVLLGQRQKALFAGLVMLAVLLAAGLVTGQPAIILAGLALAVFGGVAFLVQWALRKLP